MAKDKPVTIVDGTVMYVPPSQQECQGPVEKPGEPVPVEPVEETAEPKALGQKAKPMPLGPAADPDMPLGPPAKK
jgi:hypothetical protein